jgi:stage V sporulation protein B
MLILNIINRIIDFVYDVSLSNILGAEAIGWFQIGLSTLMIFNTITTSGIPTSITKLVAEENSKGNKQNVENIYRSTIVFNLFVSVILAIILLIFSDSIAIKVFKNEYLLYGVYSLAPAIIILSLSNVFRAYFYGMRNVITPSIAQIIEHFARFIIIIGILMFIKPVEPIHGTMIALFGISIGEFFDLLFSYVSKKKHYTYKINSPNKDNNSFMLLSKILLVSFPLTISGLLEVMLNFSNTLLIPSRLNAAGYTVSESIATLGRINGMAMPLIGLSFMFTSSLVTNLIPSLSEQMVLKKYNDMRNDIRLAIKATFLMSVPLMFVYVFLAKPLAIFLYKDPIVADYIHIMGYGTTLLALQHILSGILYGLNKHVAATFNRLFMMILNVILIYFLVGNPNLGINGYFISFFISHIVVILLNTATLRKIIKLKLDYFDIIGKPFIASIFMIGYIKMTTYDLDNLQNGNLFAFIFCLMIAALSYIFVLILTKAIPKDFLKKIFTSSK